MMVEAGRPTGRTDSLTGDEALAQLAQPAASVGVVGLGVRPGLAAGR